VSPLDLYPTPRCVSLYLITLWHNGTRFSKQQRERKASSASAECSQAVGVNGALARLDATQLASATMIASGGVISWRTAVEPVRAV
jgi:hypothetical protein